MTIKRRLILSYIGMLLIPFILILITAVSIQTYYKGDVLFEGDKETHGIVLNDYSVFLTSLKETMSEDPGLFLDKNVASELEDKLPKNRTGLFINLDGAYIYYTGRGENRAGFRLHHVERLEALFFWDISIDGKNGFIKVADIDRKEKNPIAFLILLIIIILVFISTNSFLTYMVLRSITRPINYLQKAAIKIKKGDLDTITEYKNTDEFSEVFNTFNEMRIRLKESIDTQIKSEENRKELVSNISHDLRTPMTIIKGYVEGIRDGVANSPEKLRRYLQIIYSKTLIMDNLIDELFLFSKLDLNKINFNIVEIELVHTLKIFSEEFSLERDVHVNFKDGGYTSLKVLSDKVHLNRIITNLMENAVKYRGERPLEINVLFEVSDSTVTVEIADNGMGMDEEVLSHMFERFYRGESSRNQSGSGLGLAIVKGILKGLNGNIWAKSEIGKGSSIFFTLPRSL